jgi:drug/metabolite transporter (DMT)-like permease
MTRLRAELLLLFAAAIWGLAFVFQKTAMATLGPCTFIAARGILATMALLPFAWFEYIRARESSRDTLAFAPAGIREAAAVAGVTFFVAAAFQQYGLTTATATNGGFLTALYVVLTPPLAWLMRGTKPGPVLLPAVALSAFGTWLLGGGAFSALSVGDWLIAACAIFWAAHVIFSENGVAFNRPVLFTCLQFAVVAALATVGAVATESVSFAALWSAAGEILYVGLLSSALTFTILTYALKYAPASEAAVIVSTESLFAAFAGASLLGERLTPVAWLGAALIMAAVILVQLGPKSSQMSTVEDLRG